ncbi:endoproteinase ArgC [Verminephrobacter aporrectodeae subsp. tuberculatae]|nr:endoproteinase ArgC [Verminephrobacter aporrectodeae subsp. tuberculatae]MCW8170958.1 endoproteinase ArgC [Verminephrobacter aporrectodeae subsp. tuberculatae]
MAFMFRFPIKSVGLCAMLALTACGGEGGDDNSASAQAPSPAPAPAQVAGDRIEPLDSGPRRSMAKSQVETALPRSSQPVLATAVRLGPLTEEPNLKKKMQAAPEPGIPRQIGVARSVAATATAQSTHAQLRWQPAPGGMQRAAISFTSEDAWGVRPGLLVRSLPANTTLRFYAQVGTEVVQVSGAEVLRTVQRNLDAGDTSDAARTYWAPDFGGAETTLELELPAKANLAELDVAVPTLSHFFVSPAKADATPIAKDLGDADRCNVDVSCNTQYSSESRAVARMTFVKDGGSSYLCTGTLLNDIRSSRTPYFLSADHCIPTQTVASTLTTDWFYRSTACDSKEPNADTQHVTGGATLLHSNILTDTAFMRLNASAPQGSVYAGSYFGAMSKNADVAGIHHARGDMQKISTGSITQFSDCSFLDDNLYCPISTEQSSNSYEVRWKQGITEQGSSGSGLFYSIGSTRYLVGQLSGGNSRCLRWGARTTGRDNYGRFDLVFRSALKNWLKPGS